MTEADAQQKIRERRRLALLYLSIAALMCLLMILEPVLFHKGMEALPEIVVSGTLLLGILVYLVHIVRKGPLQLLTDEERRSVEDFMQQEEPMPPDDRLRPA